MLTAHKIQIMALSPLANFMATLQKKLPRDHFDIRPDNAVSRSMLLPFPEETHVRRRLTNTQNTGQWENSAERVVFPLVPLDGCSSMERGDGSLNLKDLLIDDLLFGKDRLDSSAIDRWSNSSGLIDSALDLPPRIPRRSPSL
jgi:hypothetical protein